MKKPNTVKKQKQVVLTYLYERYKSETEPLAKEIKNGLEIKKYISFPIYCLTISNIAQRYNDEFNAIIGSNELQEILNGLTKEELIEQLHIFNDRTSFKITEKGCHQIETNIYIEWMKKPDNLWKIIVGIFAILAFAIPFSVKYLLPEKNQPTNKKETININQSKSDTLLSTQKDTVVKYKEVKLKSVFGTKYSEDYLKAHPELREK